ncbi:MAG: radical SAM protein [Candidatus Wallbacteria bacterium]|nr:radical SAM protein [Candidatus Wallbacteria bacterium]
MLERVKIKMQEATNRLSARLSGNYYPDSILAVELTNFCNCNCVMCTQSMNAAYGQRKGFMPQATVRKILESVSERNVRIGKLLPFGLGESLLHPAFLEILKEILQFNQGRKHFESIDLHTNAILLDDKIIEVMLNSPATIDTLSFSLDAASDETYGKIRRNRQLNNATENIRRFFRKRNETGLKLPKAHLQFIVMEQNRHEARQFLEQWSDFFNELGIPFQVNYDWNPPMRIDTIFFKRLNPFKNSELASAEALHRDVAKELGLIPPEKHSETGRIIDSQEYIEHERPAARRPCSGPFKYQSIGWDGKLTVCCIDTGRELTIGNVVETPLFSLWEGDKNSSYRLWQIKGEFDKMPKCTICHNLDSPQLSDDEITEFLKRKGHAELIPIFFERIYG